MLTQKQRLMLVVPCICKFDNGIRVYLILHLKSASSAAAYCLSKTPPCPTLKNGRQSAKRLPENVRFTASLSRLAASNSSSEYISQTTKNSGEIPKQLDSQGISFFISINIFGKSFANVHKKANWLCRIEWHLWYRPNRQFV